jgi:hypothetical protein
MLTYQRLIASPQRYGRRPAAAHGGDALRDLLDPRLKGR